MSTIANLKKAFQTRAITQDTYSLQDYVTKFADQEGNARMEVVGLEVKYIPQFDKNHQSARPDTQGNGFRTRFFLKDGSTVGTFSNGAYNFFRFFAELMGYDQESNFLHIDITGVIQVDISKIKLDGNKSTYNFELIEEGSELEGFSDYLPTVNNVLQISASRPEANPEGNEK